jgi:hypothetical protein
MADRRWAACRLPVASQWAASDREATCLAELYSEPASLFEQLTEEATARAKPQRQLPQCRHLQYRR